MFSAPRTEAARRPTIWSTASFRLAGLFAIVFGLGAALLLVWLDLALVRFVETETRAGLTHQMEIMQADAEREGGHALIDTLRAQSRNSQARRYLFLVVAPDGATFSNGLTQEALGAERGFRTVRAAEKRAARWPDQTPNMVMLSRTASDGTLLAIGRDAQYLDELRAGVRKLALWGGAALIGLAILAGLTLGYLFLRRLEQANAAVARIVSGRSSERLPAIGFGREFDDLARNLNHMLDRQEAAMEALREVSVGIAHELRSPLSRLRNRLEELALEPEGRQASAEAALEEMDEVSALFEDLLTLARVEGGEAAADFAPLDLAALVEDVAGAYRPVVEQAGGAILVHAPEPVIATAHRRLLAQTLANLVENAINHCPAPVCVELEASREDGRLVLSVSDDGPGVPVQEREAILRRFYRRDASRSRPGTGLGLTLCAAVAQLHGGRLVVTDRRPEDDALEPGTGLRIEIQLPGDESAGAQTARKPAAAKRTI